MAGLPGVDPLPETPVEGWLIAFGVGEPLGEVDEVLPLSKFPGVVRPGVRVVPGVPVDPPTPAAPAPVNPLEPLRPPAPTPD